MAPLLQASPRVHSPPSPASTQPSVDALEQTPTTPAKPLTLGLNCHHRQVTPSLPAHSKTSPAQQLEALFSAMEHQRVFLLMSHPVHSLTVAAITTPRLKTLVALSMLLGYNPVLSHLPPLLPVVLIP